MLAINHGSLIIQLCSQIPSRLMQWRVPARAQVRAPSRAAVVVSTLVCTFAIECIHILKNSVTKANCLNQIAYIFFQAYAP